MKPVVIDQLQIMHQQKELVNITFEIHRSLALVGESGSGKSLTLKALLGLLEPELEIRFEKTCDFEWRAGETLALVPQNPFTALSPLTKIKDQLFFSQDKSEELFELLGLERTLMNRYPPDLSGGELQRVVVAMAIGSAPRLLLLDEPTTALDPDSKHSMIQLLKELQQRMGFKMLFVTHDMGVASAVCEDICVLKEGSIIEKGKFADVLRFPKEVYTKALIEAEFKTRGFRD